MSYSSGPLGKSGGQALSARLQRRLVYTHCYWLDFTMCRTDCWMSCRSVG